MSAGSSALLLQEVIPHSSQIKQKFSNGDLGVDMTPIIIPLRQFLDEAHLEIPALPQSPIVTSVPESRLIMSWWEQEVKIWRIQELGYDENKGDELYLFPGEEEGRGRELLSRIVLAVSSP